MEQINIGFDADGVLFDTELFQLSKDVQEFMEQKFGLHVVNEKGYGIKDVFGCSKEIEMKFWTNFVVQYSLFYKARPWIKETIDRVRKEGHKVYIITSKACSLEKNIKGLAVRFLFELGLKMNGIVVDGIEYCSLDNSAEDKKLACEKHNIRIMIEDKHENIDYLSESIDVVCMETLNNQEKEFNHRVLYARDGNELYSVLFGYIANLNKQITIWNTFVHKTKEEKQKLTLKEKNEYYDALSTYYKALPYNEKDIHMHEQIMRVVASLFDFCFSKKYKPIIIGKENLPKEKGMIFVCNHLCSKDVVFLLSALRGNLYGWHVLAKRELLDEPAGILFQLADSVFVDRKSPKGRAVSLTELAKHLANGHNVLIFPEGTYNRGNDNLKKFEGVSHVYLSQVLKKPLVHMALTKDYTKQPILHIDKPYIISREESIEEANEKSYQTLYQLVEKNKKLSK